MASPEELTYSVPGASCDHCVAAIETELGKIAAVESVAVDLTAKRVTVSGATLDAQAIERAIDEAGYDATPA